MRWALKRVGSVEKKVVERSLQLIGVEKAVSSIGNAERYEALFSYEIRASSSAGVTLFTGDLLKPLLSRVTT